MEEKRTLNEKLSTSIRMMRVGKKLKQADVAKKLGISVASYSRIETGKVNINVNTLETLSDILDIQINFNSSVSMDLSFPNSQVSFGEGNGIYSGDGTFPTHPATEFIQIKKGVGGDWWYKKKAKEQFTVRDCKNRSELVDMDGTSQYDCSDFYIVDNGLYNGSAILKKHCKPANMKTKKSNLKKEQS